MSRSTGAQQPPKESRSARQPRELLEEADRLRLQGKLDRAEAICYPLTRRYPGYLAALHTLGLVYLDKGNFERALDCLIRASMLDPQNWMTLTALSLTYLRLGANEMAAQILDRAVALNPMDASIFASLGEVRRDEREYEVAQQAYRQALTLDPNLESAAIGLALCLSALGQTEEAAKVLSEMHGRGHRSLNLLHVLTTLPPSTVRVDVLGALDRWAADQSLADLDMKNSFLFARGAALDIAGRHAEAWQTLVAANRPLAVAHQGELKEDIARREKSLARLRGASHIAIEPRNEKLPISLFVFGPSRSGKTSVERLVSSLDGVKTGCEVPIVERAVRRAFQAAAIPASSHLEELPAALLPAFRENYLDDLRRRAGSARVFTSTVPSRIHHAAILAMTVPNVRFVLVKRSFDDVAWRTYLTKYRYGNPYAYDLKAIREYLHWYNMMIDLTAEKLPQIAHVVTYEDMVGDPAAVLSKVANLCGLSPKGNPVPVLGNDRGCAAPYLQFMAED